MSVERLVALNVIDLKTYQQYREAMTPILHDHGGKFGYDFEIAQVLKSEATHDINRVFTLRFDTEDNLQAFFTNPDYLSIKKRFFYPSVADVTEIAKYPK